MGRKPRFTKEVLNSAIEEMEKICAKYGISPNYLGKITTEKRYGKYKQVNRKFQYGFLIPDEKKIRKPLPKEVEDLILENIDCPTSEIVNIIFDKFPNIDKSKTVLRSCVYYRKHKEECCQLARDKHRKDPSAKREHDLKYYHNRLKIVGIYTKKQKERGDGHVV